MDSFECLSSLDVELYIKALNELEKFLKPLLLYFEQNKNICAMTSSRIKDFNSIIDKAKRKDIKVNQIKENIRDIAGFRIVFCYKNDFVSDFTNFDSRIKNMRAECFKKMFISYAKNGDYCNNVYVEDFVFFLKTYIQNFCSDNYFIIGEKNYIVEPKRESGYQSHHIILMTPQGVPVEIQVRDFLQHLFAEYEHENRYKADNETRQKYNDLFNGCANVLSNLSNIDSDSSDVVKTYKKVM